MSRRKNCRIVLTILAVLVATSTMMGSIQVFAEDASGTQSTESPAAVLESTGPESAAPATVELPEADEGTSPSLGTSGDPQAETVEKYAITITQPVFGTLKVTSGEGDAQTTLASGDMVEKGTELTITVTQEDGHPISALLLNGEFVLTDGNNPFSTTCTVTENLTVAAQMQMRIMMASASQLIITDANYGTAIGDFFTALSGSSLDTSLEIVLNQSAGNKAVASSTDWTNLFGIQNNQTITITGNSKQIDAPNGTLDGKLVLNSVNLQGNSTINAGTNDVELGTGVTGGSIDVTGAGNIKIQSGNVGTASGVAVVISGGTVTTATGTTSVAVSGGRTTNVNGGTVALSGTGTIGGITPSGNLNGTTLTVTGGTISATGGTMAGNINISAGTVASGAIVSTTATTPVAPYAVSISGAAAATTIAGTVQCSTAGTVYVNGGTVSATTGFVKNTGTGAVTVAAGTINGTISGNNTGLVTVSGGSVANASIGSGGITINATTGGSVGTITATAPMTVNGCGSSGSIGTITGSSANVVNLTLSSLNSNLTIASGTYIKGSIANGSTARTITFNGTVTLSDDFAISTGAGQISIGGTLAGAGKTLTLPVTTNLSSVLNLSDITVAGVATLSAGANALNLNVGVSSSTLSSITSTTGNIAINSTDAGGSPAVSLSALASIITNGSSGTNGTITIGTNVTTKPLATITSSSGTIVIRSGTSATDTAVTTTSGNITLTGAAVKSITSNGATTNTGTISVQPGGSVATAITHNGAGTITINTSGAIGSIDAQRGTVDLNSFTSATPINSITGSIVKVTGATTGTVTTANVYSSITVDAGNVTTVTAMGDIAVNIGSASTGTVGKITATTARNVTLAIDRLNGPLEITTNVNLTGKINGNNASSTAQNLTLPASPTTTNLFGTSFTIQNVVMQSSPAISATATAFTMDSTITGSAIASIGVGTGAVSVKSGNVSGAVTGGTVAIDTTGSVTGPVTGGNTSTVTISNSLNTIASVTGYNVVVNGGKITDAYVSNSINVSSGSVATVTANGAITVTIGSASTGTVGKITATTARNVTLAIDRLNGPLEITTNVNLTGKINGNNASSTAQNLTLPASPTTTNLFGTSFTIQNVVMQNSPVISATATNFTMDAGITGSAIAAINVGTGTVTIKSGSITGLTQGGAAYISGGSLTGGISTTGIIQITGGTVSGPLTSTTGNITVSAGTVTAGAVNSTSGAVSVSVGTYTGITTRGNIEVKGTAAVNGDVTVSAGGSGTIDVTDNSAVTGSIIGRGGTVTVNTTGAIGTTPPTSTVTGTAIVNIYKAGNTIYRVSGDTVNVTQTASGPPTASVTTINGSRNVNINTTGTIGSIDASGTVIVYGSGNTTGSPTTPVFGRYVTVRGGNVGEVNGGNGSTIGSVTIEGTGHAVTVYGGGSAKVSGTAQVIGDVYGGKNNISFTNTDSTTVLIDSTATPTVGGSVYGGSLNANLTGTTTVTVKTAVGSAGTHVYGGGNGGSVGATSVTIEAAINSGNGNVYGGGKEGTAGGTNVYLKTNSSIKDVYGGGTGTGAKPGTVASTNIEGTAGTISGNAYGGGDGANAVVSGATIVNLKYMTLSGATSTVYGGGNGSATGNTTSGTTVKLDNMTFSGTGTAFGGGKGAAVTSTDATITNTTIKNNVYGGGDGGPVTGLSKITLGTGANLSTSKDVYGGSLSSTAVSTQVIIGTVSGTVSGNVYGGGHAGSVSSSTTVTVNSGTITGNVYGGGYNNNSGSGAANVETANVTVNGGSTVVINGTVYGGGNAAGTSTTTTIVLIQGTIKNDVFGGGYRSPVTGTANITIGSDGVIGTYGGTQRDVYGGGEESTAKGTTVTVNAGTINGTVYGGGKGTNATIDTTGTNVTVGTNGTSSVTGDVYGGSALTVNGPTIVTVSGGTVGGTVYGGGKGVSGNVTGSTNVTIGYVSGSVSAKALQNVYGGGDQAVVGGDSTVKIINNGAVTQDVYGGGIGAKVNGSTTVEVSGSGTVGIHIYGGGDGANSNVNGSTKVTIGGTGIGAGGSVYGGGKSSTVNNTVVTVSKDVGGSIYGGGNGGAVVYTTSVPGGLSTSVTVSGGTITGHVYGGGTGSSSDVTGNTSVEISSGKIGTANDSTNNRNVYGGGTNGSAVINNGNADVTISGGTVTGTVYGGGDMTTVSGNTTVTVKNTGSLVNQDVYGGGNAADVNGLGGATIVILNGKIDGTVYGGGYNSDVQKTTIAMSGGEVVKNVYGGGSDAGGQVTTATDVTISGGKIGKSVYGGGEGRPVITNANVKIGSESGSTATVLENVYGGGRNATVGNLVTGGSTIVTILKTGNVEGHVYGGGATSGSDILNGNANVHIYGKIIKNVYGGGSDSNVKGSVGAIVNIFGGGLVKGNVYGGGQNGTIVKDTFVTVAANGIVEGIVFGGGVNNTSTSSKEVTGKATVHVFGTVAGTVGDVYGGGDKSNVRDNAGTTVLINGTVGHDVYGGGRDNGDILGTNGTTVTINGSVGNDVYGGGNNGLVNGSKGTTVTLNAQGHVGQTIYGGGVNGGHVGGAEGTDVFIYGRASSVYGGGKLSNVTGAEGAVVLVKGASAIVSNYAYGGGQNGTTTKTDVTIHDGANVGDSVFGGGNGTNGGSGTIDTTTSIKIYGLDTIIGNPGIVKAMDNQAAINGGQYKQWGQVYGGGNNAGVGAATSIDINGVKQVAFGRVSGGNLNMRSSNTPRTINLTSLGADTAIHVIPIYNTVFFSLQDYTEADAYGCFLTIYYNLKSTDNGSEYGLTNTHASIFTMHGGVYMPWRPYPHTDILVEPAVVMSGRAKLRMEAGYTTLFSSLVSCTDVNPNTIGLRIDQAKASTSTTCKIYGLDDNIVAEGFFDYSEMLTTLVATNMISRTGPEVTGINIYLPPRNVESGNGNTTNSGGANTPDSGYSGGGGGGGGGGGIPLTELPSIITDAPSATAQSPSGILVDTNTIDKKVELEVKRAGAGKTALITESKADLISGDTLRSMLATATKAGGKVILYADTMNGVAVEGRMYLDPSKALSIKNTIQTRVYTRADKTAAAANMFDKYFKNKVAIIHLNHADSLGMEVEIAVKVKLIGLDTKQLKFYSYSTKTNKYTQITNPRYFIDSKGYLHFFTGVGNDIVITDQILQRK